MVESLLVSSILAAAAALVYLIVGRSVQRRQVSDQNWTANQLFAVWWYALGLQTLITGGVSIAYLSGQRDVSLFLAIRLLNLLIVCVALWGLLYYLVFLFTGRSGALMPLATGYLLYFFLLVYFIIAQQPNGVVSDGWQIQLAFANPDTGPLYGLVIVLLAVPQIIGAIALLTFAFRLTDAERKFRVIVVGTSILIWFGSAFIGLALGIYYTVAWQLGVRIVGLAAALAILTAYRPPPVLRRWFQNRNASVMNPKVLQTRTAPSGSVTLRPILR